MDKTALYIIVAILSVTPAIAIFALTYILIGAMRMVKGQEPFPDNPKWALTRKKAPPAKKDDAKRAKV